MNYMGTKEASRKWGLSDRRIRLLCSEGRIEGAIKNAGNWLIPVDAVKPADGRKVIRKKYSGLRYDFSIIDSLKAAIDGYRPFSKRLAASLREKLIVEWTYNSNAIEGNTLTMSETKVVLEGITIGGKSIREHLEVINHRDAILYVEELAQSKEPFSERNIKDLHALVVKGIDADNAGRYRRENVVVSGAKHLPPKYYELDHLMQALVEEYHSNWQDCHPVVRATLLHGEFVKVHPFVDGNGRTARLLLNLELMRRGYTPIIIKDTERARYYDALNTAHTTMNYEPFLSLISSLVVTSAELWLSVLQ